MTRQAITTAANSLGCYHDQFHYCDLKGLPKIPIKIGQEDPPTTFLLSVNIFSGFADPRIYPFCILEFGIESRQQIKIEKKNGMWNKVN